MVEQELARLKTELALQGPFPQEEVVARMVEAHKADQEFNVASPPLRNCCGT